MNPSHNCGRFYSLAEIFLVALNLSNRGKFIFTARVRAGIINWPGEGFPSSNIDSGLNMTIIFLLK